MFVLSGWCSGTGMSGLIGTLSYLGLKSVGIPNYLTFLIFTILIPILYYMIFRFINNKKNKLIIQSTF